MRAAVDVDLSRWECHVLSLLLDAIQSGPLADGDPLAVYESGGPRSLSHFLRGRVVRRHPGRTVTVRFAKSQALALGTFIVHTVPDHWRDVARRLECDMSGAVTLLAAGVRLRDAGLSKRGKRSALDPWKVRGEYERLVPPAIAAPRLLGRARLTRTQILQVLANRFSCDERTIERALRRAVVSPAVHALTRFPE